MTTVTEVFLIDKGAHHTPKVPRPRLNPQEIKCDLDESLDRLHTDYIDLYLLHRDDPQIPVATIIEYLNQEIESGRILAFGASNWTHQRIQKANEYAAQNGLIGFAVSSSNLSLAVPMEAMWPGCPLRLRRSPALASGKSDSADVLVFTGERVFQRAIYT